MWCYLFGRNVRYPDPVGEIEALGSLDQAGAPVFLKLSSRDDAPLKGAVPGDRVYLCTRDSGRWAIHGEADVVGEPIRGATPRSMVPLYGTEGRHRWWRRLERVRIYGTPRSPSDLGLDEGALPAAGQAHVIRAAARANGSPHPGPTPADPLATLTALMDAACEAGRLTPETIDAAVRAHRARHPYGR